MNKDVEMCNVECIGMKLKKKMQFKTDFWDRLRNNKPLPLPHARRHRSMV